MNILIVGGAGYLGGAVTDILQKTNHHLMVYDLLLYEETYRKNIPFVYGDTRDQNKLRKCLDWADVVIWLAALVGDPACSLNEHLTRQINRDSVEYLVHHFKKKIIFMSTCSVYGAGEGILKEDSELNPLSLYAVTKREAEQVLEGSNALIFRLGTLFGISDQFSRIRFDLVVNTLVMRAICHKHITVFGGLQYRPLLHVRDVAKLIVSALNSKQRGIYNLHYENTTIDEIAKRIEKYFSDVRVERTETKFQDNRNYRVSSDKAVKDLDFKPSVTIEDGVLELKQLLEEGRVKDSFLKRFSNYAFLKPLIAEYQLPLGKIMKFNI